jgi:hypothetical protein
MKKRKNMKTMGTMGTSHYDTQQLSMTMASGPHISKGKPSARDGHASCVFLNKLIIFGGDRHHMPFNDAFFLDLAL